MQGMYAKKKHDGYVLKLIFNFGLTKENRIYFFLSSLCRNPSIILSPSCHPALPCSFLTSNAFT
jgi:hypothetical protein